MPRQLTKRGHRLVFSNGIIFLAVAAIALLLVTDAQVERLIPLYAIGVFLSFTLSQAGMSRHHITKKEPGWRRGLVVNALGAVVSGVVCVIIAVTKFSHGAWFIILLIPFLVWMLMRLNRQYETEEEVLIRDAPKVATQPILRRHVVVVLVDTMDMASARALQYARTLTPDELSAVHFDLDPIRTEDLADAWSRAGYDRVPLDIVACPDRRLDRAAAEVVARHLVDGDTEVSVLIPRREYSRFWHRLVHDRTADDLSRTLSTLPHCNVTVVPFHIASPSEVPKLVVPVGTGGAGDGSAPKGRKAKAKAKAVPTIDLGDFELPADRTPISDVAFRQRVRVAGKVYALRVQPWSGTPALELTLIDDTGALLVVFLGRRQLAGVKVGSRLVVEGVVGEHKGRMAMLNPVYELQADPHALAEAPPAH